MPSSPTPEAWAKIRHDYEQTDRPLEDICVEHGFTANTLRHRARKWGWRLRRARIPAEGPPAVASFQTATTKLGRRFRGGEQAEGEACSFVQEPSHPNPLPHSSSKTGVNALMGEREHTAIAAAHDPDVEPSPHIGGPIAPAADGSVPIGERLQGAVARVLPAIETTLARLSAGPIRPREMEMAARALGSLTRTLRELNGLLGQHKAEEPRRDVEELREGLRRKPEEIIAERDDDLPEDMDEFRNELARRIEIFVASREAQIPERYEAAWNEFAAAGQDNPSP